MKFQALSVIKPYGQLINSGKKTVEVRQWAPDTLPIFDLVIIENSIRLSSTGVSYDPEGVVVAMVDIRTTREWVENDLVASCSAVFENGWLAWELSNIRRLHYPHFVPAGLRIYSIDLDSELIERCSAPDKRV